MKTAFLNWSGHFDLMFSAFFVATALVGPLTIASTLFLCLASHHIFHFMDRREIARQRDLIDTCFKQQYSQIECIEELAMKLIPHLGVDEVLAILARHQVEWEKIWKDFDGKHPRNKKKKPKEAKAPVLSLSPVGA